MSSGGRSSPPNKQSTMEGLGEITGARNPGGNQRSTSGGEMSGMFPQLGDAITAIFLLRDYGKFGLMERVCYHFDLTEALALVGEASSTEKTKRPHAPTINQGHTTGSGAVSDGNAGTSKASDNGIPRRDSMTSSFRSSPSASGVSSLLECTPVTSWQRLSKRQKRALRQQLRSFNVAAQEAATSGDTCCYQPTELPLSLNPSTRMFFAYEVTRIAFCVDASASMTSTFGIHGSGFTSASTMSAAPCCPLDRLPEMAKIFFTSLADPISAPSLPGVGIWQPILSVTVIAVFPLGKKAETSLLVRDFRLDSVEAAEALVEQIEKWIHNEVEVGISERLVRRNIASSWSMPLYSSSLRDILEAADYSLSVLSSDARPLIVVATDGRSISCDGIVDVFLDIDRVDVPVIVLDLSPPETHATEGEFHPTVSDKSELNFLTYDPGGPSDFPLHLSDDSEALYRVCRATGGCFLDSRMLEEKSKSIAGQSTTTSETPTPYHYSYKRRFVKMNGVQWLTLFSLSPLSPTFHASSGKLAPPQYLKTRLGIGAGSTNGNPQDISSPTGTSRVQRRASLGMIGSGPSGIGATDPLSFSKHGTFAKIKASSNEPIALFMPAPYLTAPKQSANTTHARATFSTYFVSPVRIKSLLVMRIKEGYRAKQYGMSTKAADKVFIQFTLPLELGTVLHYELSYKALASHDHMVGSAHIKIELSGDLNFVQAVKNDFLRQQGHESRPFTMAQKVSARLCQVMRWIRREDILLSYLSPPSQWSDQLASAESPFARRLALMTSLQRRRHFRLDAFDVICTGKMPYATADDAFLSEFISPGDNGEQELFDLLQSWSTQAIDKEKTTYAKAATTSDGTTFYCLVNVRQSCLAPRLFTLTLEFHGGTDSRERLRLLTNLKHKIEMLKDVQVLGKQMGPFLLGTAQSSTLNKRNVEFEYHHATWDLVKDPELLPLLMKRRTEIGSFRLLRSDDHAAIFAKVVPEQVHDIPGDLIQYQIAFLPHKVVVDLHMESQCGLFFPFCSSGGFAKRFNGMVHVLRRRDQECGRALRSRTNLLSAIQGGPPSSMMETECHTESVKRMLQYSSRVSRKLHFFNSSARGANEVLERMIEDLLLSNSFGVQAAKLSIEAGEIIKEETEGLWFVIQFDRHTMSMVHLSSVDKVDSDPDSDYHTYRNLSYFTSGISDLYSKREDTNDDDSVDSHISEYLCVTEFAEHFEMTENDNFASASYLALRSHDSVIESFERSDFERVQRSLDFVEVASVLVAGNGLQDTVDSKRSLSDSKLTRLIQTILSPVPGDDKCLFYDGGDILNENFSLSDDESQSLDADAPTIASSNDSHQMLELMDIDENPSNDDSSRDDKKKQLQTAPHPLFVRFKLDGQNIPFTALTNIPRSASLSAEISLLKGNFEPRCSSLEITSLPWTHQAVATEINILLKWYVAEQTIERLRHHGPAISQDNLRVVKKCMKRVQSIFSFSIEVFFYISKSDLMVPASAPAGGESEVGEGFRLLYDELRRNTIFNFNPVQSGGFFVSLVNDGQVLPFWCFLYVQPNEGLVSSQTYHPDGEPGALDVMSRIHEEIRLCIHRVNQQLLLKSLHQNRAVSSFLIPETKEESEIVDSAVGDSNRQTFIPGSFACPVVYKTLFDLFHRCATNPSQVARTLEATVLHNFAVSNRSRLFVYKDEDERIFYMSLEARGSGIDGDGKVELLVHGINEPGPSVTEQLTKLLQRRLLLIAVDMLSSVLTKNPHFRVSSADLQFLRAFDDEWSKLEKNPDRTDKERYLELPDIAFDPCMVLLMFRQNLCGSTFFHRLNDIGYNHLSLPVTEHRRLEEGGSILKWNQHDFTLYYNNAASKLDQSFQSVSTLTEKGAALSQQVGSGMAMVEISLVRANGTNVDEVTFAQPAMTSGVNVRENIEAIRVRRLLKFHDESDRICVRIRIIDTALSRSHLHEWIELTLNQALAAWVMERCIEKFSYANPGLNVFLSTPSQPLPLDKALRRRKALEDFSPGLSSLSFILETSQSLPHPAMSKIENHGVIRSSTVATKTLELLETCILSSLMKDPKLGEALAKAMPNLRIIRISRYGKPELVHLSWDVTRQKAVVTIISKTGGEREVQDSPIDCPEYICFYQLTRHGNREDKIDPALCVYKEVMIYDGISDRSPTIELLESLKERNQLAFLRSFAFVFSVKRNRRSLLTYNWHPSFVKSVASRLKESDQRYLQAAGRSMQRLQLQNLRMLSPAAKVKEINDQKQIPKPPRTKTTSPINNAGSTSQQSTDSRTGPARRIRRPVMIRRPKLVGKSVEGAAMQAVAASRKRASSNQFRNNMAVSVSSRKSANQTSSSMGRATPSKTDTNPKLLRRPPTTVRRQRDDEEKDPNLIRVKDDFMALCRYEFWQMRRQSSRQMEAILLLSNTWWPRKVNQAIPWAVADFIISRTPLTWTSTCPIPSFPSTIADSFLPIFARWLATFSSDLAILPIRSNSPVANAKTVFLSSITRNVRGRKCLSVVRISIGENVARKEAPTIIRFHGWILTLSRRSKKDQLKKLDSNVITSTILEKDATGLDKLTTDIQRSLFLSSLLFDFGSSIVERAVRLRDERIDNQDLIPCLRGLMRCKSLAQQKRMPMLNYRIFEANLVLKSYKNKMIDQFDSKTLLDGLRDEVDERDLVQCGDGFFFKRGINIKGCHSLCFLTADPVEKARMRLVILCRTQGRNLSDYIFREGSNVAMHTLDYIVFEASGLVYNELSYMAEKLYKDALWTSLSTKGVQKGKSFADIQQALDLFVSRPILQSLGTNTREGSKEIMATLLGSSSGIDWEDCCHSMKAQPVFSPYWSSQSTDKKVYLFYVESGEVFILLEVDLEGILRRADIIEKDDTITMLDRQAIIQMFANYLLHFIWQNL